MDVGPLDELGALREPLPPPVGDREQRRYATVLKVGTRLGLGLLVVLFVLYLGGVLPALVPHEDLSGVWGLPLAEYLARTGAPTGWGWVSHLHFGDFASVAGVAVLASCSVPCLLAVIPLYARRGDRLYAMLCAAEVAVLALAASGIFAIGH